MITVHQPKIFSRNLVLYDGDSPIGEIRFRAWSGTAEILTGGKSYEGVRSGWFTNSYRLQRDGVEVASTEQVGFWSRSYEVRAGSATFTLRRKSGWFATGFDLLDGDSPVGSITRKGAFRTQTSAEFDASVDLTTQVFVVWVANVLWQQDQAAAAAG